MSYPRALVFPPQRALALDIRLRFDVNMLVRLFVPGGGFRLFLRRDEGQAMVEFALLLFPVLLLVGGILQFGIALNYWLDTQRLANQGARWAVVNEYPGCPRTGPSAPCNPTLQRQVACEGISDGFRPSTTIGFPLGATKNKRGDQVKVTVSSSFTVIPIVGVGTLTLSGDATMRIEQDATRYTAGTYTPGACP